MTLPVSRSPASNSSIASLRRASRNAGSRSARALTVSLNSFVSAMSSCLFLACLIVHPSSKCRIDILLLTALGPSTQQNDEVVPVAPEIDSIPRAKVYPKLENSAADAFDVRDVALGETC